VFGGWCIYLHRRLVPMLFPAVARGNWRLSDMYSHTNARVTFPPRPCDRGFSFYGLDTLRHVIPGIPDQLGNAVPNHIIGGIRLKDRQ
jgi:hypothetical protein